MRIPISYSSHWANKMVKKSVLASLAVPAAVFAQDQGGASALDTAITQLQSTGTAAAASIAPMVIAVAVAFAGIGLAIVAVRWFRRAAR